MGAAYFYHLTRAPLEVTLAQLIGKARGAGWRVAVRGTEAAQMAWLDDKLWQGADDSFLPHGLAPGPHDGDQPVLLTTSSDIANQAPCLMALGGAAIEPSEVNILQRVCVLFDGNDPAAVDVARQQWKALTGAGCAAQYWSEESGQWQMKAESKT